MIKTLLMQSFSVKTNKRNQLVDITQQVLRIVQDAGVVNGVCVVYTPHTTAAVTINENADPSVPEDILNFLGKLIPQNAPFRHTEGNSDAHLKSSLVGCSLTVIVGNSRLLLGTWQSIFFCEFDGPRTRTVYVKPVSSA